MRLDGRCTRAPRQTDGDRPPPARPRRRGVARWRGRRDRRTRRASATGSPTAVTVTVTLDACVHLASPPRELRLP